MSKPHDRKALGKGLSALLPAKGQAKQTPPPPPTDAPTPAPAEATSTGALKIPVDSIDPNPLQPRAVFDPQHLAELAQSIVANGIIQPLIVQRAADRYQLIAGERRWRAAKLAGLTEVPVVLQEIASDRLLEVALIENIQREDLNAIEVAHALNRLATEYDLSHEEIGRRTGKDRASVTNVLRLLKLPDPVQVMVAEHRLTMGHARAILGLTEPDDQIGMANRAERERLSVRDVERLVQTFNTRRPVEPKPSAQPTPPDPNVLAATRELEAALGTRVRIVSQSRSRGRIEIEYFSNDELDRLYNLIVGTK